MAKRSRDTPASSSDNEDSASEAVAKYSHTEPSDDHTQATESLSIRCFLPPHHPYSFNSYQDFDSHYYKSHVNRCADCTKNFPTDHFLNLHIAEVHDSLAEAKRARGDKTFGCFVEDCDKVCFTPQKRRLHLIDKHHFPKNYNFFITKDGLDKRHSMLVPRTRQWRLSQQLQGDLGDAKEADVELATSASPEAPPSVTSEGGVEILTPPSSSADADMDTLTSNMSSLKFVPNSVRFGRGGRGAKRGGLARK